MLRGVLSRIARSTAIQCLRTRCSRLRARTTRESSYSRRTHATPGPRRCRTGLHRHVCGQRSRPAGARDGMATAMASGDGMLFSLLDSICCSSLRSCSSSFARYAADSADVFADALTAPFAGRALLAASYLARLPRTALRAPMHLGASSTVGGALPPLSHLWQHRASSCKMRTARNKK